MTINKIAGRFIFPIFALLMLATAGCSVKYSFSGASIDPKIGTVSITYFPNMAANVAPILSPTLTDELTDKISRETRLRIVREDADVSFEGEITDYRSTPEAISGNEFALQNRLTIVVRVRYVNKIQPQFSFDRSFTAYENYSYTSMLNTVEGQLIPQIVEKLVEDIFNAAFSNW